MKNREIMGFPKTGYDISTYSSQGAIFSAHGEGWKDGHPQLHATHSQIPLETGWLRFFADCLIGSNSSAPYHKPSFDRYTISS